MLRLLENQMNLWHFKKVISKFNFKRKENKRRDLLSLALLELLTFTVLFCIIWLNEVNDYTFVYFGVPADAPNVYRGYILSGAVIFCAIISIGCTHLHAKYIIRGMITICSQCRKIRLKEESWADADQYISDYSLADLSHGLCPDCSSKAMKEITDQSERIAAEGQTSAKT